MLEFKKTPLAIAVQGYKGGGSRTPVEAPNTLKSVALANILDLVSEGPIRGLVNGLKSVYLDETPVENADGSRNFTNFQIDYRLGTPDQTPIAGFESVENEIGVNVELKSDAPFVRTFTNVNLDAIRIRLSVAALASTNKENGDISGFNVAYNIALSTDNGPFVTVLTTAFNGKTMSKYERDHKIDLPPANLNWSIRVTRTTPNATVAEIQDKTYVESIVEVIEAKLRYPNSAIIGQTLEAGQFTNIPSRAFEIYGRIIRVPTNYNPETRIYTGVWDGTFKLAYTDNPAWIYYDLATHPRYGLGHLIGDQQVNKWSLYAIGQYCDQLVPDGRGGQEPRFTCNLYLQKQADAYKVLQDLATVFRGIAYWANGEILAISDRPEEPVFTYSPANVIGGHFTGEGSARKTRYNVALVSWNDMTNMGRAAIEYVDDPESIARYGIQQTDVAAIGCTSQAQAQRIGRYLLATSRFETQSVSFQVGLDGTLIAPGKIVLINDPLRAGARLGGRIASVPNNTSVVVDGEPGQVAVGDTFRVVLPDGTMESRVVQTIVGNQIVVSVPFTQMPTAESMWSSERTTVEALRYRIISVTEDEDGRYSVQAIRHVEGKFANADNGVRIDPPREQQMTPAVQEPITGLTLSHYDAASYVTTSQVVVAAWSGAKNAVEYQVEWKRDAGEWTKVPNVTGTTFDIRDAWEGVYLVRVRAVNSNKIMSQPVTSTPYNLTTLMTPPGVIEEVIEQAENNYQELLEADRDNAQAIAEEAARAAAKEAELAAADAAEAIARAEEDAKNAQAIAQEATDRGQAITNAVTGLQNQITAIDTEIGNILGAADWKQTNAYAINTIVNNAGKLYKARSAVPANIPITNATYWEPIGNYATIVGQVNATAASVTQLTTRVTNTEGTVSTLTNDVTSLKTRVSNAEGTLVSNGSAITALQTDMTTAKGNISSQGSAITQLQNDVTDAKANISANAGAITGLTTRVSSVEGTVTAQGQAITNVQAGLNNIGGDNLLGNSGFDASNLTGWNAAGTVTGVTRSYVDSILPNSVKALRIQMVNVATTGYSEIVSNSAIQQVRIEPGKKHTMSAYIRGNGAARAFFQIAWRDSAGAVITYSGTPGGVPFVTTENWDRKVFTLTAPANAVTGNAYVRIYGANTADQWAEIDNVMLQVGEVATGYMPSANEAANQIAANATATGALTATVTQHGNTLTSQGNSITELNSSIGDLRSADNVISNGGFTVGVTDWFDSASGSSFSWDGTLRALVSGPGSLRVRSQGFVVNPGDKIVISFKYLLSAGVASTASDTVGLITSLSSPTNWLVSNSNWASATAAGTWQNRTYTWDIPVDTVPGTMVYLRFAVGTITPNTGLIRLDDVVVNVPSQPAATAKALSDMTTRVTSAEGNITSQGNAITNLTNALGNKADASALTALTTRVASTEGTLTSQGGLITTLTNNLNNIGGDNLLLNSSFEQRASEFSAPINWVLEGTIPSGIAQSYVDSPLSGGGKAYRLDGTTTAVNQYLGLAMTNTAAIRPVAKGATDYTLSGWFRAPAGEVVRAYIQFLNAAGSTIGTITSPDQIATGEWQRYVLTGRTTLTTAASIRVFPGRLFTAASGKATWIEMDNVMLQEGAVATQWSPNIVEVNNVANASASAISSLTTRVTNAEGTLTSQGGNITTLTNKMTGLSALGDNIIPNSNFATGIDWWNAQLNGSSASSITWGATFGNNGPGVVITRGAGAANSPYIQANEGIWMPVRTATSGNRRTYKGYVWAKSATAGASLLCRMAVRTNGGSEGTADVSLTLTTTWTRYPIEWSSILESRTEILFRLFSQTAGNAVSISNFEVYDVTEQLTGEATASALSSLTTRVTAAEGTINSTSQSLTSLSNTVNTVMASGPNIMIDGGFEGYANGASIPTLMSNGTFLASNADKQTGNMSGRLLRTIAPSSANTDAYFGPIINTSEGRVFYIEGWMKSDANGTAPGSATARLGVSSVSASGVRTWQWASALINISTLTAWTKVSGYVTAPAGVAGMQLIVNILGGAAASGVAVFVDNVMWQDVTEAYAAQSTANAASTALTGLTSTVTNQGTTITSQGTQITSLNNTVNIIRSMGQNLIPNSDFATGLDLWTVGGNTGGNTITWSATNGDGRPGVVMTRTNGTVPFIDANGGTFIPARGGNIYRFVVRCRLLSGSGNVLLRRHTRNAAGVQSSADKTINAVAAWTEFTMDTVASASDAVLAQFRIHIHPNNGSVAFDKIEVYDVTNQLANEATADAVTTLTNRVTATEGSITSASSQITSLQNTLKINANTLKNSTFVRGGGDWLYTVGQVNFLSDGTNGPHAGLIENPSGQRVIYQDVSALSGAGNYTFSADIARGSAAGNVFIQIEPFVGATPQTPTATTIPTTSLNTWNRYSVTANIASNVTKIRVLLWSNNATARVSIRRAKLEYGSIATVWSDETESLANATAVSTLSTWVNSADGVLNAHSSQITALNVSLGGKAEASVVQSMDVKLNRNLQGGGNLVVNSTFAADLNGWIWAWNAPGSWGIGRDGPDGNWVPEGGHCMMIAANGQVNGDGFGVVYNGTRVPVIAGTKYIFSARTASHRCQTNLAIRWHDGAGNNIGEPQGNWRPARGNGGRDLGQWDYDAVYAVAPPGAIAAQFGFWVTGTGESNPYAWFTQPQFEQVEMDKTWPSPYAPGGADNYASWSVYTTVEGYVSGIQLKQTGQSSDFTVMADRFRIIKPGSNQRTEYSDGNWRVYDGNGTLRVRLGVW